jgi:hypothetical protein
MKRDKERLAPTENTHIQFAGAAAPNSTYEIVAAAGLEIAKVAGAAELPNSGRCLEVCKLAA